MSKKAVEFLEKIWIEKEGGGNEKENRPSGTSGKGNTISHR